MFPLNRFSPLRIVAAATGLACLATAAAAAEENLYLVRDGRATGVVVLPAGADARRRADAEAFVGIVRRSTGAALPIVEEGAPMPGAEVFLYVGPTARAAKEGLRPADLPEEGYRLAARGNAVCLVGRDAVPVRRFSPVSRPTCWALNRLLEERLGVRWLWPGELGTYVPRHADFAIPADVDLSYQPKLLQRSLRLNLKEENPLAAEAGLDQRLKQEAVAWAENHQVGRRGEIRFGHSFRDWWRRFGQEHPDYFTEPLPGRVQPYPHEERVKLRLANPAVIEQIARDYEAAGAPDFYNICPNDGSGFDVSAESRAWDIPADQPPEKIWDATANLTARYVRFWNLLDERLRRINPNVTLVGYAYSSYRFAPPPERPLTARMVLGLVPQLDELDLWKAWAATGTRLWLRPNWWHAGADAPFFRLRKMADYLHFAGANGMAGLDMDSVVGYWAAHGPAYYLVARLMTHPELTRDQIVDEYASAFGQGAPKIREYLDYWESVSEAYSGMAPFPANFTGVEEKAKALAAKAKDRNAMRGMFYGLPVLYSEEVIAPGEKCLDEAAAMIGDSDPEALRRVAFLRGALEDLRAAREAVALGLKVRRRPPAELVKEFRAASRALETLRGRLSERGSLWGSAVTAYEKRRQFLFWPENLNLPQPKMEGLE